MHSGGALQVEGPEEVFLFDGSIPGLYGVATKYSLHLTGEHEEERDFAARWRSLLENLNCDETRPWQQMLHSDTLGVQSLVRRCPSNLNISNGEQPLWDYLL
jgi:hypothetical protein